RPDLDASEAGRRDLRCNLNCLVQISGLNEVIAAELLFGLGIRAIGSRELPVSYSDSRGGRDRLKPVAPEGMPGFFDPLSEREILAVDRLELGFRHFLRRRLVVIY